MTIGIAAGGSIQSLSPDELNRQLNDYQSLGAEWIRFDFNWADIQAGGPTTYKWAPYDAVVQAALARGLSVLGTIDYTPAWELPSGYSDLYHSPPKSANDYAGFCTQVVTRYAPMGVHAWEIWNEPNNTFIIADYTSLLKAAYPAIKQADPSALVLTGGTQPFAANAIAPTEFLTGIYQNGGGGSFDAVAHHPYCYSTGFVFPFYAEWSAWSQMQDTQISLRSIMTANRDQGKQIWITEFGAPTSEDPNAISEADQALLVTNAYNLFQAYSWSGPLFWFSYKDYTGGNFGLVRPDYSHKPSYKAYQSISTENSLRSVI
jgi:hypothetical protein